MVSLIVPVYNIGLYLEQCISSILAQTFKEFELILVDDGSTDGSSRLCDLYKKRDNRIKVIHKENGGLVSARKAGMAAAQGEYIGFVDGDDWIDPQMYEQLVKAAVKYQADMVACGCIEDLKGQTVYKTNQFRAGVYDKEKLKKEVYPYMLCKENFFSMGGQPYIWNKLMRYELAYEHIMAVDDRIRVGEDAAVIMPMFLKADKVVMLDYCGYHYCIHETSMMWRHENEEKEWEELCILHRFLQTVFRQHMGQARLEYQLSHYTIGNMMTRAYARIAERDGAGVLWPFGYRINNRKCIVYSAGNFGRQVYAYLQNNYPHSEVLWIDREHQKYQSMGMPVHSVEEVSKEKEADILIAVLNMRLAREMRKNLLRLGMCQERLYSIHISENEVRNILGSI